MPAPLLTAGTVRCALVRDGWYVHRVNGSALWPAHYYVTDDSGQRRPGLYGAERSVFIQWGAAVVQQTTAKN